MLPKVPTALRLSTVSLAMMLLLMASVVRAVPGLCCGFEVRNEKVTVASCCAPATCAAALPGSGKVNDPAPTKCPHDCSTWFLENLTELKLTHSLGNSAKVVKGSNSEADFLVTTLAERLHVADSGPPINDSSQPIYLKLGILLL